MPLSRARRLLVQRLQRRKTREREQLYLAEGVRCVDEVVRAGARLRCVAVSPRLERSAAGAALRTLLDDNLGDVELLQLSDAELAESAATDSPQGVWAVVEQPQDQLTTLATASRLLFLDAIQDPGNVGTLIRSATAFGIDGVVALDGTADPWNAKAVRAAAGYCARVPIIVASVESALQAFADLGLVIAAVDGTPVSEAEIVPPWGLVIGNEGAGVRDVLAARCRHRVAVPMSDARDSLNAGVAGSILLHSLCSRPTAARTHEPGETS